MDSQEAVRFYGEEDGDMGALAGKTVAVVGYGNHGRPQALNMRDSGLDNIIVGSIRDASWDRAEEDGFAVFAIPEACARADVVLLLLPDEVVPEVYQADIAPNLKSGSAVVLASGYVLAYGLLTPGKDLDVLLLAPRMLGEDARDLFLKGHGFPSFVSVEQDSTGQAWTVLLALAKAIGSLKAGVMVLSATQEAHLDLFMEQGFGPLLGAGIMASFQVAVDAGFPAEAVVLELYMSGEMSRTLDTMARLGFFRQVTQHGFAAAYGGMVRTMALDQEAIQENMRRALDEIRSGAFTEQLQAEVSAGYPSRAIIDAMMEDDSNPIARAEEQVRSKMRLVYQLNPSSLPPSGKP